MYRGPVRPNQLDDRPAEIPAYVPLDESFDITSDIPLTYLLRYLPI